jgi:hypothetical protein
MKESALTQEGTLSILVSNREQVSVNPERFKARMVRLVNATSELWAEFRRLQRYVRERCREEE